MKKKTSQTDPLYVSGIQVGKGMIGLTFCPGKKAPGLSGAIWDRDLDSDLVEIKAWGVNQVITLVEQDELDLLPVPDLGERVSAHGMEWLHLPIVDGEAPREKVLEIWDSHSPTLHRLVEGGERIVFHCRGGLGRAGTMAALFLIEGGESVQEAISRVRQARPGAIETRVQERYLYGLEVGQ